MDQRNTPRLPWWLWLLALLAGLLLGAGAVSYAPQGRINLLLVWLLWAGLPALSSLVALLTLLRRHQRPWIARFAGLSRYWQPDAINYWWLTSRLQAFWLLMALGILLAFLTLLLFSDLAFGWSSTLLSDTQQIARLLQGISLPWQAFWPQAVPDALLIEQTRYTRIEPGTSRFAEASRWWPFLLASLLIYNLLPRLLLALFCQLRWRQAQRAALQIQSRSTAQPTSHIRQPLLQGQAADWAKAPRIAWQLADTGASLQLGQGDWQQETQGWQNWLQQAPTRLVWQVDSRQTPVAELADHLASARQQGIQQALEIRQQATTSARHLASWQAFAREQQLIWLEPQ